MVGLQFGLQRNFEWPGSVPTGMTQPDQSAEKGRVHQRPFEPFGGDVESAALNVERKHNAFSYQEEMYLATVRREHESPGRSTRKRLAKEAEAHRENMVDARMALLNAKEQAWDAIAAAVKAAPTDIGRTV